MIVWHCTATVFGIVHHTIYRWSNVLFARPASVLHSSQSSYHRVTLLAQTRKTRVCSVVSCKATTRKLAFQVLEASPIRQPHLHFTRQQETLGRMPAIVTLMKNMRRPFQTKRYLQHKQKPQRLSPSTSHTASHRRLRGNVCGVAILFASL